MERLNTHRLVIVGSLHENVELVERAKERGYYTIVCDGYKDGPAKAISDKSYDIDVRDVDAIAKMCVKEKADGIVGSFSDLVFEQITKIAYLAKLKWYATPDILKYYRDKAEQKKLLKEIGVSVPKNAIISEKNSVESVSDFSFPIVVKPVRGWGSKDIIVLECKEDCESFLENFSGISDKEYEFEEYIDAFEYDTISWVKNGTVNIISIADRERNPKQKNQIPTLNRLVYPSVRYYELKQKVRDVLQAFVNHTGQKNGPISMQFFYKNNEIIVCEIAGRILGHEHKLIPYCDGSDILTLLLDYVYDEDKITIKEIKTDSTACGIYFLCKRNTYISNISQAKKALQEDCVKDVFWFCEEGQFYDYSYLYPYFMRCYINADSRSTVNTVTKRIFDNMAVFDDKGNNVIVPFFIEDRE